MGIVARPDFIVSHELSLDEAPDAYRHFDARENGWTEVVLKPEQGGKTKHAHAHKHEKAEVKAKAKA